MIRGPGGVAQWASPLPREQKTWVRISPGYNVLGKTLQCCCVTLTTKCIIFELIKREIKALAQKYF
jgi:hypothetical protein